MTYLSLHSQRQSQVSNQGRWNQSFSPLHSAASSGLPKKLKSVKISRKVKMQSCCSGDISSQIYKSSSSCQIYKTAFSKESQIMIVCTVRLPLYCWIPHTWIQTISDQKYSKQCPESSKKQNLNLQ